MSPVAINGVDKQGVYINGLQVKQALSALNETVNKGVYDPTTLSAVDADLAAGNIKEAITIFGKLGTVIPGGVETFEREHIEDLASNGLYTPATEGIFSATLESADLQVYLEATAWRTAYTSCESLDAIIGDGSHLRFKNVNVAARNLVVMRHYISTGTYERYYLGDVADGASYTPADEGFFSFAGEWATIEMELQYSAGVWWPYLSYKRTGPVDDWKVLGIGDGTNLRVHCTAGIDTEAVIFRAVMT